MKTLVKLLTMLRSTHDDSYLGSKMMDLRCDVKREDIWVDLSIEEQIIVQ